MTLPTKPCHNCRRRRLRCDRSFPHCHKCTNAGQECLGYQALLIWTPGIKSYGKKAGCVASTGGRPQHPTQARPRLRVPFITSQNADAAAGLAAASAAYDLKSESQQASSHASRLQCAKRRDTFEVINIKCPLGRSLTDPFFQDVDQDTRFYISHFSHSVCKDLVIYDLPQQNPFRDLIPLTAKHSVLQSIVIANSALNISNAAQRSVLKPLSRSPQSQPAARTSPRLHISSTSQSSSWYTKALIAKQRALRLLNATLSDICSTDIDVVLGSILLFTEFELADFGSSDWKVHIRGATALINSIKKSYKLEDDNASSLRRALISNCLVYDVLSSTLTYSAPSGSHGRRSSTVFSSLQYAEINNYLSFPAVLLEAVLIAAQFSRTVQDTCLKKSINVSQQHQIEALLYTAESFDIEHWASMLQSTSPRGDRATRIHVASAHKAAVCIYISRVLMQLSPTAKAQGDLGLWVSDIISHLSFVTSTSEFFKATSWPSFVAGAETRDPIQQAWAMTRLQELWEGLPCTMGYVRSAMEILGDIWDKRDAEMCSDSDTHTSDWIHDLKMSEIDLMVA